ncbi:ubiquitin carboxyl-terminal hydrolase 25-like [Artemia franciscana]|uniref:ubiquitin carboxyl-terminal hydrolase 25-like n=1 Tax=Artemia franciscana TaxID=6661 RepID=UPI0032DB8549
MVPKPAIPARISSSDQEDRGTNITATELTGGMVPNLQVAEPVGTKAHGPQNDPNKQVIDLTDEPDEDLQKALALSLQEEHERNTGFISQEQADIDRAVAASMSDGTISRRTVAFREAENPREKIRRDNWPVGLKNVGNTCWFSAVIQSLFYIPEFRRLVLEFTPHKIESKDLESRELRNVSLVTNLRRLFALMLRGRRKYLDPSECISILRSGLGDTFSQHDVSETTHLLLQWLEEAFSLWNKKLLEEEGKEKGQMELEMEIERKGENSSCIQNPLIGLFYGQLAVETVNGNRIDGRTEQYSQCIIQVSGMSDLHQGIEAFTKESVESSPMVEANQNSPSKPNSSQSYRTLRSLGLIRERWFQDLPPVLTFELKRFLFNSVSKRPEKIHDRVLFPRRIFMDRYLQSNREKVVELRTIADDLLSRKQQLEERILRIDEFGNETEKYSLPRVLRYTRRFIESRRTRTTLFSSQPVENTRLRTVASTSSPHRRRSLSATDFAGQESESKRCRVLTNEEFQVIDTCLDELHEEICKDLEQLGKDVAKIDAKVDMLYDKPDLQTVAYDLHAVMVHGGEAASGHYWSYIWDQNRDTWMKFNDHLVTEASWTELEKDAYGGPHTKASAYCLIYVDEKKRDNLLGSNFEDNLPSDLMQFVEEDSKKLEEECQAWDEKQREPMEVDETSTVNASNAEVPNSVVVSLPTQSAEPQIDFNKWELAPPGSNFSIEQSSLEKVQEHQKYESANDMFNAVIFVFVSKFVLCFYVFYVELEDNT